MRRKPRHHENGSVVLMAVGLLVMLAMIGTTFIIVSHMDRREASSLVAAAPMKEIAAGVVQQIVADRFEDLRISDNGTPNNLADDVVYGAATDFKQQMDYPADGYDSVLASAEPLQGYWIHLTNVHGAHTNMVTRVSATHPKLADTDGFVNFVKSGTNYTGDALLWDSGVRDSLGREYWVAVRVIDGNGLVDANLAYAPAAAQANVTMRPTDVSLEVLGGGTPAQRATIPPSIHAARCDPNKPSTVPDYWTNFALRPIKPLMLFRPFMMDDMLAIRWGGALPNTATGRLFDALGAQFNNVKPHLTVRSASRIFPRKTGGAVTKTYMADLNKSPFADLYAAYYDLLAFNGNAGARRKMAAQLAVNTIDFRDADSIVTEATIPTGADKVFGIERQPFIVEAGFKRENVGDNIVSYDAVELLNPYTTAINTAGWKVKVGAAAPVDLGNLNIPAGKRLVLFNRTEVRIDEADAIKQKIDTLSLNDAVRILRPSAGGALVVVGAVGKDDFGATKPDGAPAPAAPLINCIQRNDHLPAALYTLDLVKEMAIDITSNASNLGKANGNHAFTIDNKPAAPCPVYVRNTTIDPKTNKELPSFLNVGDVSRIFYVGPGEDHSLSSQLTETTNLANGRLDLAGAVQASANPRIPAVPPGCMISDFLMVDSPMADGVDNDVDDIMGGGQKCDKNDPDGGEEIVLGLININTASAKVFACLPALAKLPQVERDKIINWIITYRDGAALMMYMRPILAIPGLRMDPGFATAGEFALALRLGNVLGGVPAHWKLPQNAYAADNSAPYNYAVANNSDDGLSTANGRRVDNDLIKQHVYYSWCSNQITVRSDVCIAYIRVQIGDDPKVTENVRRYLAVIDRSNCRNVKDLPQVVMFTEIR